MKSYTMSARLEVPFPRAVEATRSALADQGFGVISEIDLSGTLRAKIGAELPDQIILGACQSALAYQALEVDPSIATLIPVNVVVRAVEEDLTEVEIFDPATIAGLTGGDAVRRLAVDARERLVAALSSLPE